MKKGVRVKIGVVSLGCIMLAGCSDYSNYVPPTSHFATGQYACYYNDVRNGHFYKAIDDEKENAMRAARNTCIHTPPKDLEHHYCEFAECIFK